MKTLSSHYQSIVEGDRLFRSRAHSIEFYTTLGVIEKYLTKPGRILELGAGHGVYSLYLAEQGHSVVATDIVEDNVNKMSALVTKENEANLEVRQLDALEASKVFKAEFDLTLCLGPLYHLRREEERATCLRECAAVTGEGGILILAYINKHFAIPYIQSLGAQFNKKDYEEMAKTSWDYKDFPDDFMNISYYSTPEAMAEEVEESGLKILDHVAADGMYTLLKDSIEKLTDEAFRDLLDYHMSKASLLSSLGASSHNLIICQK
ncbi:MAG: class I SAM-dependent methyltransferase [Spirochaetales bacterium]|nr:class I SAM-dependent methyltransferase [Spirochaetales bacterium]